MFSNWLGAPTNFFRILLASSIAVMKSPMLNPKLILLHYSRFNPVGRFEWRMSGPASNNVCTRLMEKIY